MNVHEPFGLKNRRKTQVSSLEAKLNFSKLKYLRRRSNSTRKVNILKDNNIQNNPININILDRKNKKNLLDNNIKTKPALSKKFTYYKFGNNKVNNYNDNIYEKNTNDILNAKTQRLLNRYSLINNNNNNNKENLIRKKTTVNPVDKTYVSDLNIIERNIKSIINKMKNEIERKNKKPEISNSISPLMVRNRLFSSPSLKLLFTKRKINNRKSKNKRGSLIIETYHTKELNNSFFKENKIRRSKSFNFSEQQKKKIFKKFKKKNNFKNMLTNYFTINSDNIFDNDSDNEENLKGIAILPTSNYIFTFDLLLIIANLYTFIFFPLSIAHNRDIRNKDSIIKEIIHYLIDLIYICDLIISFFRGFYNYEMDIIKNNKKIVSNYLKKDFTSDLLEAIPIFSMIRIFIKYNNNIYSYNSENLIKFITILLFIKPFKIFKIIRKKHNRALEDFYSYLSENFYLEQLAKFLIYFFIFFLFVHLFVCLHIYFAFQSYPNWLIHTNIINDSFFVKYITSFYFMITTMTTVGYGDIICISFIERIYHIILLVIGTLLYTFLVSKIGNYLRDESHEQIKLNKDLNILENIRVSYPTMSFKLYNKIKNHLLSIFKKRKKAGISILINGVPDAIKNDLLFKIYFNVINEFTIFKNVKNSNFIIQVLTSFIPIVSKKEEIIILEGEIIQNIVFVKDGKLSMEISIDLNNPIISIKNYLENNFIGISRQEELQKHNINDRINTLLHTKKNTYNDLKSRIDNIISNNQNNTSNNNTIYNNHGLSIDLGRMDFERSEIEERDNENFQIIKIMDIRKNEHFGSIHILLEQSSPFTLKTKSRIANLFLLPKLDVMTISKNFPNIWKRLENKSYHNLVSIKKRTFNILKKFYNTNIINKNTKESNINFNLDLTKNSEILFPERKQSIITNNLRTITIKKTINTSTDKESFKSGKKYINNSFKRNKLYIEYNDKKKNSIDSFEKELNISVDSINSINSNFQNSTNKKEDSYIKRIGSKDLNQNIKTKELEKIFSFQVNNENNKNNGLIPKNRLSIKSELNIQFKKNNEKYKNKQTHIIKDKIDLNKFYDDSSNMSNDSYKYSEQKTKEIIEDYNDTKILTLEDVNKNFSEKIKRKIKKRKIIQKLKELLKLTGLKINKNILKQNSINKSNANESEKLNCLEYSISSINNKILSKIFETSYNEDINLSVTKNNKYFIEQSFKKIKVESFEIKSSYKNINKLTNGKIIKSKKYKIFKKI